MKNIITLTITCLFGILSAQTYQEIKGLENDEGESTEEGVYYKDINNVLDTFEGIYEYDGTDFYFKLKLEKKELSNNNNYFWEDLLKGSYLYIVNGNETNYLDDPLASDDNPARMEINSIQDADDSALPYICDDCLNEKWLKGWVVDDVTGKSATISIIKKIVDGEEGLQVLLHISATNLKSWEIDQPIQLPIGVFFMKKIE